MKTNIGTIDQVIRITVGLVLPFLYAAGEIGAWGLVGLPLLITGLVRFCPFYGVLGVRTCRTSTPL